jgi:hypothetical protein
MPFDFERCFTPSQNVRNCLVLLPLLLPIATDIIIVTATTLADAVVGAAALVALPLLLS